MRDARGKKLGVRLEPDAEGALLSPALEVRATRSQVEVRAVTPAGEVRYLQRDVLPRTSEGACPEEIPTARFVFGLEPRHGATTISHTPVLEVDALHERAAKSP